jgi:hypothetical protein
MIFLVEKTSLFFLKNSNLKGEFERNNETLFKIKEILFNEKKLNQYLRYIPQHSLAYSHNPNYIQNNNKVNNSYGFRGSEIQLDKNKETIREICMGGSTTYGFLIDELSDTYPYLLENNLQTKYPNKKIEVINAGLEAGSSIEEVMLYQFKIRYLNPDIIILRTGGNDASNISEISSNYTPDMNFLYQEIISIPTMNRKWKWLLNSNFISLSYIWLSYVNTYNEGALRHGVPSRNVNLYKENWFKKNIESVFSELKYYNFFQNYDLLTDLFIKDSVRFYSMPFLLNQNIEIDSLYFKLNTLNNSIMKDITMKKGGVWIQMSEEEFPLDSWLGDDCHYNYTGNKILSKIAANSIKIN